jgi:hypothetical protein
LNVATNTPTARTMTTTTIPMTIAILRMETSQY